MKFILSAVFFLSPFFSVHSANAQLRGEDSLNFQAAAQKTIAVYYNQLDDQSPLYNGSLYIAYEFLFKTGSPYFSTDKFTNGSLVYNGMLFDNISLLYDDLQQFLILNKTNYPIQLVNERISSFTITGHTFIRLVADSLKTGIHKTGFYQILYPGRTQVLKWTSKNIQTELSITEGVLRYIEESDAYYIKAGAFYKRIKSKTEFLEVMKLHKKDVQRFMRKNKLNFRKDRDNTITQAAGYYDQLVK